MSAELRCMEAGRKCWGKVQRYSFDIDLPVAVLCEGHLWELMNPQTLHEKLAVAETIDGQEGNEP